MNNEWKSHAQERASQRYNKDLTEKDMNNIRQYIKNNQHTPLGCANTKNKKFCYVKYNHIPYKILYKITHKHVKLITIYPFDFEEYNNIEKEKHQLKIRKAIELLESEGYTISKGE